MAELHSNIEAEIAELSKQIAEKRNLLEKTHGIKVEDKEALTHVVGEKIHGPATPVPPAQTTPAPPRASTASPKGKSYLDDLAPENIEKVNDLIQKVPEKGILKTIEEAKKEEPFVLDAFHDALVDKLHDELRAKGIVK